MNGQPRTKSDVELRWSAIKRAIQARVNYEVQVQREVMLNERLDVAWKAFKRELEADQLPELPEEILDV